MLGEQVVAFGLPVSPAQRFVSLIGHPLAHSISAQFQQAAFDHLGLDVRYLPWDVVPEQLPTAMALLRQPRCLGANVTVPYKETLLPLLEEVTEPARRIGAVNTIVNRKGKLIGHNTDAPGFIKALRKQGDFDPGGKRAVLLGAGGAARAAAFALLEAGVSSLIIVNRTYARACALVADLRGTSAQVAAVAWEDKEMARALGDCHLVVDCTSLGMRHSATEGKSPLEADIIPAGALVYDVVYNPVDTELLKQARKAGARTLSGLPMLVYQGAMGFELWTGKRAPIDLMFKAAQEALGFPVASK